MSKAILIINNCSECPFIGYDVFTDQPRCINDCSETDRPREIYDDIDEERPDWCPLIDFPTRDQDGDRGVAYKIGQPLTEEFADRLIAFGYNDCIDEILEKANKVTDKEEENDE